MRGFVFFGGGAGHWGIIYWGFEIFLIISNFPLSLILSRSALVRQLVHAMFINSNHASFHLW